MGSDTDLRAFWENRLDADWTESGVGYHTLGRAFNTWMYRVRRAVFGREVARLDLGPAPRVLDVGSGTGFYLQCWQDAGVERIVGCDLTVAAVGRLRRRFPDLEFVRVNAADVANEFEPFSFDAVSCMDVLFHITDDEQYARAVGGVAEVLRPGGYFVLSENFLHRAEQRSAHQVNRTASAIHSILTDAGFDVVRRVPMLVLMNAQVDAPIAWRKVWGGALRAMTATEPTGWLAGAALYPLDRGLTRWLPESPTTELMICRRT
jgi:SAM-dependent methyltransferase